MAEAEDKKCSSCGHECHCEEGPCNGEENSCGCGMCSCKAKTDWG